MPLPNRGEDPPEEANRQVLVRYAGLATQYLVAIGLSVFAGLKLDRWMNLSFPLAVWLLPLLVIAAMIYKMIRDTTKN